MLQHAEQNSTATANPYSQFDFCLHWVRTKCKIAFSLCTTISVLYNCIHYQCCIIVYTMQSNEKCQCVNNFENIFTKCCFSCLFGLNKKFISEEMIVSSYRQLPNCMRTTAIILFLTIPVVNGSFLE